MPSTTNLPIEKRQGILARLKRIEGQARGIQRMVEEGRDCTAVLQQLSALKAATNGLSAETLEVFAMYCLKHPEDFSSPEEAIDLAVKAIVRAG